ncbi:hypothetical protein ACH9EU_16835 [Kocuria sp. M1R5S2]|uniref:hypothetical protein n=1 Tax=Kocuria rhizosphaerae TaxID=3376285 RepID=UPI0037BCEDC1
MFSTEAETAILILQAQSRKASDLYTQDRIDRALDEIVRNPSKTNPPEHQVRSALANAGKVMANRRRVAPVVSHEDLVIEVDAREDGYDVVELRYWLETAPLSSPARTLLLALAAGADANDLAAQHDVPVQRIRERIARARKNARADYLTTAVAA